MPILAAAAEIDITTAEQLRVVLRTADRRQATVAVDITRARFCGSAMLTALVRTHKRAVAYGRELRLDIPAGGAVARIFAITRLEDAQEAGRHVVLLHPQRPLPKVLRLLDADQMLTIKGKPRAAQSQKPVRDYPARSHPHGPQHALIPLTLAIAACFASDPSGSRDLVPPVRSAAPGGARVVVVMNGTRPRVASGSLRVL